MIDVLARNWWAIAVRGVIGVIFGIAAFVWPLHTMAFLVALFGAYMLIDGVFAAVAAVNAAKAHERWLPLLVEGVLGVIMGLVTLFLPGVAIVALVYVIAAWAILSGAMSIYGAIRLRNTVSGEWIMLLSGAVSLIWGVMLAIMPGAGAIAFLWFVGSYSIIFGILLIALALKLRGMGSHFHTAAHV
jgi:uncharacterized membrane protein HdeD (DUF308 family)